MTVTSDFICPICQSTAARPSQGFQGYELLQCLGCGLEAIWPQPSDAELDAIYQQDYYSAWGSNDDCFAEAKQLTFQGYLRKLPVITPGAKLLDVGAATGCLMDVAHHMGYNVYGVEVSADGVRAISQKHGAGRVFEGFFSDYQCPNDSFDVITMTDLLEHVRDPEQTILHCRKLLNPGGKLMIATPNTKSLSRYVEGKTWAQYKPEHLFYFSPANLQRLLEKHGFCINLSMTAWKYLTADYLASVLNKYNHSIHLSMLRGVLKMLPSRLRRVPVPVTLGEMLVLATKESCNV